MDNFITPSDSSCESNFRPNTELAKDEISKMCVLILNDYKSGKIKNLPVNERTLIRGINCESIDDRTVRAIACLFYKTEDFQNLIELVPSVLKAAIESANNKLTHQGVVSYEISRNPELAQLWNLCSGYGCTRDLGLRNFGDKFDILIEILVEQKLITKSLLTKDCWIASGDMLKDREDFVFHYEHMFNLTKEKLKTPGEGKVIQFCGSMTKSSYLKLQEKMVELYYDHVQSDSLIETTEEEIKFNFQASLCALGENEVQDEIQ